MSKVRLYIDEDSQSQGLVRALRARSVDLVAANEVEMIEIEDQQHLRWAAREGRVLYSYNASDFCRLHAEFLRRGESHAGIILAPQQRFSIGEQMRLLLRLMSVRSAEEMQNRLEFLGNWK